MKTRMLPLAEVCEFVKDGTHASPERTEGGIPVLSAEHVNDGRLSFAADRFTSERELEVFRKRLCPSSGDVLMTIVGTIGRAAVLTKNTPCVFQRSICVFRPNSGLLDSHYLRHVLESDAVKRQLERETRQVAQAGVYLESLNEIEIPIPPLSEQRRIAGQLEQADRLRRTRRYALELSDTFLPAAFLQLFGDPNKFRQSTVADFVEDGAILKVEDGNHGEAYPRSSEFGSEGIPFLTATNVSDEEVRLHEAPRLPEPRAKLLRIGWIRPDDVLLSHNATVGRVGVVPEFVGEAVVGTSLTFYRLNKERFISRFFAGMLISRFFQGQLEVLMKQTTRNQVPVTRQFGLRLFEPPLPLQEQFATLVARHERLRAVQREALRQAEHLFQSLLHRAFTTDL